MEKEKNIITILPAIPSESKNYYSNKIFHLNRITFSSEVDGDVILTSSSYQKIFGRKKKSSSNSRKRLSIVKISANGKSIHRAYRAESAGGFTENEVALSPNSIRLLSDKEGMEPTIAKISKGCRIPFYWFHPDKSIRISFKLGLLSVVLGSLPLLKNLLSFIIHFYTKIK